MKSMQRIVTTIMVCTVFMGCGLFKKANAEDERKHPGNYLTGKAEFLPGTPDSVKLVFTIKNTARKTSYANIDLLVQLKKKDGSSSCSFSRKFQSAPVKPKRKQKIYYTLHCPNAEAYSVEFLNITGDAPGK